ncbi:MAG TPA: helix-turn-helix domain-containing protein [Mycobacteriales bacterium]
MPDARAGTTDPIVLVAEALSPARDRFIAELVAATEAEIDALEHDERLSGLLHASISENIVAALHVLGNRIDPATVDAPLSAMSYARRLAQRDVPLVALLRAYRLGQKRFVNLCLQEAVRLRRDDTSQTMIELVDLTTTYVDRISEQVTLAYEIERERWVQDRGVMRRHWVTHLLSAPNPDVQHAEAVLDYRVGATHLGVEAWIDRPVDAGDVVTIFTTATSRLQKSLRAAARPLVVPTDERDMQVWFPVPAGHRLDTAEVCRELLAAGLPVRVALGNPQPGLEGFRRTMRGASRAKRLSVSAGRSAPVAVGFADVAPVALLADDPTELADFVNRTLGGLAGGGERRERLRETLLAFLRNNRSYADTAEELRVHRNTVQYRLKSALEEYGRPLGPDALHLRLALEISRWRPADITSGGR